MWAIFLVMFVIPPGATEPLFSEIPKASLQECLANVKELMTALPENKGTYVAGCKAVPLGEPA